MFCVSGIVSVSVSGLLSDCMGLDVFQDKSTTYVEGSLELHVFKSYKYENIEIDG